MESQARKFLARLWKAGSASKYIRSFDIKPGDRVVLVLRVSHCSQGRTKNLDDQEAFLRRVVEDAGGVVVGVVRRTGSGRAECVKDGEVIPSTWLWAAWRLARRHDAIILAESTDRLVRHRAFRSNERSRVNLQATEQELRDLAHTTEGAVLMTYVHPDASPTDVRSHQRKRGQAGKDRKGGRPKQKRYLPNIHTADKERRVARQMFREDASYAEVRAVVGRSRSTLQGWKRQLCG